MAMTTSLFVSLALRGSLLLSAAYAGTALLPGASAALRRLVLVLGFVAALALPFVALGLPGRPVARVVPAPAAVRVLAEALSLDAAAPAPARTSADVRTPEPAARSATGNVVVWVWAAGAVVVLARLVAGVLGARRIARRAANAPRPRRSRREVRPQEADETTELVVARSPDVDVPVVVGFLRPVVLLPAESAEWDAERLRTVLLHEAAHVRRRDGVALLVASVAAAFYWFLPLAWLMVRRLRRECELAADEDVLHTGMRATTYAGHLLAIARQASVGAFVVAMARPSELEQRVRALVSRERLPVRLTRRRTALASAAAALLLVFAACADAAPRGADAPSVRAAVSGVDGAARGVLEQEARRAKAEWGASRIALVALEPRTGAVLAMVDDDPGRPILPASTLKPIVVAAALDVSAITADQGFDCKGSREYDSSVYGKRTLRDWQQYGTLHTDEILAMSSNIGISRIFDALGGERLARALRRFHLDGAPAVIEDGSFDGAVVALGQRFPTTPLSLAAAYGVIANDGRYVAPGLEHGARSAEPVIAEATARAVRRMLVTAVSGERATGHGARIEGVAVAGKTGTSDEPDPVASFVGIVPADAPRFVILAAVVNAKSATSEGSGGTIAAPLFARVAKRLLALPL